jgi:ribonuclease VapC
VIVLGTSALLATILEEPLGSQCAEVLQRPVDFLISAGTLAEALIVAAGKDRADELDSLLTHIVVNVIEVDERLARLSLEAHQKYGKKRHPAKLNYGDCFAYALAKDLDCPLLFVGNDFSQTDITSALASQHG